MASHATLGDYKPAYDNIAALMQRDTIPRYVNLNNLAIVTK
jgi:hypothetical protein